MAISHRLSGAEEQFVFRRLEQCASRCRKSLGAAGSPQQKVGIEQQLHASPPNSCSISSLPMRSKSSGMTIWPAMKPRRFIGGIQPGYLHQGFARLGDDERFPLDGLFDQAREIGFGFVDIDRVHERFHLA